MKALTDCNQLTAVSVELISVSFENKIEFISHHRLIKHVVQEAVELMKFIFLRIYIS